MVNSTMWTPSERTWENCSVSEFFNFFFSSLCALWQLSFELSARTHSPYIASARPRSAHGERLGAAQVPRGVVGQACKVSSPQIADLWIILCYDELFSAHGSLTTRKTQRRDRAALLAETSTDSSLAIAPPVLVRLSADGKMQARVGVPASTMQPPAGRLGA